MGGYAHRSHDQGVPDWISRHDSLWLDVSLGDYVNPADHWFLRCDQESSPNLSWLVVW